MMKKDRFLNSQLYVMRKKDLIILFILHKTYPKSKKTEKVYKRKL